MLTRKSIVLLAAALSRVALFGGVALHAQGNYEIQVYGSETVEPGALMVELHSNYTAEGSHPAPFGRLAADGTEPTTHALHETVELTRGITPWFETGFYIFTSAHPDFGWEWVGDHIRPRVRVPDSWHWPVGASLSAEVGYQRARFSPDTWTWELRPILDKQIGRLYLALNPALEGSWHGPGAGKPPEFSPNAKAAYDVFRWQRGGDAKAVTLGLEYYGATGPLDGFDALRDQQQQFVPTIDLNVSPRWEFNFGVGVGVTQATDHLLVKGYLGRRFSFGRKRSRSLPGR